MKATLFLLIFGLHSFFFCFSNTIKKHDTLIVPRVSLLHYCDDPRQVEAIAQTLYGVFMLASLGKWAATDNDLHPLVVRRFRLHFGR